MLQFSLCECVVGLFILRPERCISAVRDTNLNLPDTDQYPTGFTYEPARLVCEPGRFGFEPWSVCVKSPRGSYRTLKQPRHSLSKLFGR